MNIIKEHIKNSTYKPVYLLYGSESYLKKLYRNKLKDGILGDSDAMNLSYFEGKSIDILEVRHMAETMPFFADRRLIIIENSNWFKSSTEFADVLKELPESTHIIFVESEVDKRNRLYKAVKELGYISEMNGMDERNLRLFAVSLFGKEKKKITDSTLTLFLNVVGSNMETICNEAEKVICYAIEREVITEQDILSVCTEQITNRIFQMIDAIAQKNQGKAFKLYYDLITLREKPLSILFLMIRHFNLLLQVKQLSASFMNQKTISSKIGVPPFAVTKYLTQAKNFTKQQIIESISFGTDLEEQVKTGKINEQICVEFMLVKCSSLC